MNEIDMLRATIKGLSLAVPRWVEDIGDEDAVALLLLLDDLRSLRQELAEVEAYAESQAVRAMPRNRLELPDGRVAERHRSGRRKDWQHSRILAELWARALGDAEGDLDAAGHGLIDQVVQHAGIAYWRASVGLPLANYSVREAGRRTVTIGTKPAEGAA